MTTPQNSANPEELLGTTSSEQGKQELLEQLLKPEVQESLTTLIEQLPKINELLAVLTKSYDLAQSVATDEVLINDTVSFIKEIAEPVKDSLKNVAATAIEAKDRAEGNPERIGLFGMLQMVKNPQTQKYLRFLNAYLQLESERDSRK